MRQFFSRYFPLFIIVSLSSFIAFKNFTPGTWLTGWDNLHPEFNFPLNISRALSAVWQEYQGVGLLGGMAHAADLPRLIVLWPVSLFLPAHLIRYFWTFLMLLIGPLGVYFLVSRLARPLAGFPAAIFYLLNLASVQTFFTPFETFVSFYGFLPWLLFLALNYLESGRRRNLLTFGVISLLATPAFYVQTMFIVYLLILLFPALETIASHGVSGFKRFMVLGLTILAVNSFWLFPAAYFSLTNSEVVSLAHQNSIATPETQIFNEARGSLGDIALLKGYWFDYYDLGANNQFDYLYAPWIDHLTKPFVATCGYLIFGGAILGMVLNLFMRKSTLKVSGILLLVLVYFMLATTNPPFGPVFSFISGRIPLFGEVFRNVFTKWSVAGALVYGLGIGYLFNVLVHIFSRNFLKPLLLASLAAFILATTYTVTPAFRGELVSKKMRVRIPEHYFSAMSYLNSQTEGRVAFLPIQSFWGWNFYDWGYRGSGFMWYGLKNPILDRAFDVWSPANESFYNEIAFALYAKDGPAFVRTLEKYQVRYLLLDESVVNAGGTNKVLYVPEIKNILAGANIAEAAKFGFLTIYKTNQDGFITAPASYVKVNTDLKYSQIDTIYSKYNNYIEDSRATVFPFVNFDKRGGVGISVFDSSLVFQNRPNGVTLTLPAVNVIREVFGKERGFPNGYNCDLKKKGSAVKEITDEGNLYVARGGGVSCDYFYYPELDYSQGYLLRIKGENKEGRGLKIYLQNNAANQMDLQELLPVGSFDETFTILPKPHLSGDYGYTVNVETRSFGKISSANLVEAIEFYPVDFFYLTNLVSSRQSVLAVTNNLEVKKVNKIGTWLYKVDTERDGLVVLGQGYDDGWTAFGLEHVKVNSWANGWLVINEPTVVIFYWPQLLEYLGFFFLIVSFLYLVKVDKR
jgi:hypothetical protein